MDPRGSVARVRTYPTTRRERFGACGPLWVRLPGIDVPWTRLAGRVLESYERDGLVAFASPWRGLLDEFADHLAGAADKDDLGGVIGEWLLDKDEVDEVFADDRALARVVIEQARRLAAESSAEATAPAARDDEDDEDDDEPEPLDPELLAREAWIARWVRRPFTPRTREGDGASTASKFCGAALLRPGEAWPVCPGCGQPMRLFVQLDLATLPPALPYPHREGMVQLFYCTNTDPLCEVDHEAWQPFGKSSLARWLSPAEQAHAAKSSSPLDHPPDDHPPEGPSDEPAAMILGWAQGSPELPEYEPDVPPPPDDMEIDEALRPRAGDKLGGWPAWVQGPEYPRCPRCKARMTVLLQLESNGLCRHQFGDLGAGHLCQCPEHPDVVAFGWACH